MEYYSGAELEDSDQSHDEFGGGDKKEMLKKMKTKVYTDEPDKVVEYDDIMS